MATRAAPPAPPAAQPAINWSEFLEICKVSCKVGIGGSLGGAVGSLFTRSVSVLTGSVLGFLTGPLLFAILFGFDYMELKAENFSTDFFSGTINVALTAGVLLLSGASPLGSLVAAVASVAGSFLGLVYIL